jgi:alpha-glucosidase (family GH31 glycosyl hydrolase)
MGSFIICTHHQILLGRSNQGEWDGQGVWHAWERAETCRGFWWEIPKETDHLEDQGVDGIRMDLREIGWGRCEVDSPGSG